MRHGEQNRDRQRRHAEHFTRHHHRGELPAVLASLRQHHAKLRQMRPQGIDQARVLTHQQVARPVDQQHRLLFLALDRYEPHRGGVTASQIAAASAMSFF
jgi:hypothetical protein